MRYLNRLVWSTVVAVAFAAPAAAQQGGSNLGGSNLGGSNMGGSNQGSMSGGFGSQNGSQGGSTSNAFQLQQIDSAPTITAPGSSTTSGRTGSSVIAQSNVFGKYYGNPLYQGIPANSQANSGPGGFGAPLYTTTAAGTAAGGRGVTQTRGFGGGALGANSQQSGVIVQLPIQISYQAVARFPITPVAAPQLQADIAGMISRTTEIGNPAGVTVVAEGTTVTLRGMVKDLDEAKTLVSMVRMTPGVHAVKNELKLQKP